jgi:hypothetical protein
MPDKEDALTIEKLNQLINIMLKIDTVEKALAICFTKQTLIENNALEDYTTSNIGDILRECIYLNKCRKLTIKDEQLKEGDLIVILKYVLKKFSYKMLTDVNRKNNNMRIYSICKT